MFGVDEVALAWRGEARGWIDHSKGPAEPYLPNSPSGQYDILCGENDFAVQCFSHVMNGPEIA
jgi:hypothetical protein